MKNEVFFEVLGELEPEMLEEAEQTTVARKSVRWLPLALSAAAAVLLFVGGFFLFKHLGGSQSGPTLIVKHVPASDSASAVTEIYHEYPWTERMNPDRYKVTEYGGCKYTTRLILVHEEHVGEKLGEGRVSGYDTYKEEQHELTVPVYAIRGIDPNVGICVTFPDEPDRAYAYTDFSFTPKDLKEFINALNLRETMTTDLVYVGEYTPEGQIVYEGVPTSLVWDILLDDTSVENEGSEQYKTAGRVLSIATSVDLIGCHNLSISLTADGLLCTNVPDWTGKVFRIGAEKVQRFVQEVEKNYQGYRYIYDLEEDGKTGQPEGNLEGGIVNGETVIEHTQEE